MNTEHIMKGKGRKVRFVLDEEGEKWYSAIDVVGVLTEEVDYDKHRRYWAEIKKRYFGDDEDDDIVFLNKLGITTSDGRQVMSDVLSDSGILLVACDIARTYRAKGFKYVDRGDILKAIDFCEKSVRILEHFYGKNHIETALSQNSLGIFYGKLGNLSKAHEYLRKPLAARIILEGEEEHEIACYNICWGDDCREYFDYDAALKYYKRALSIFTKESEKSYADIADNYARLGWIYMEMRDYKASLRCYKKALSSERMCEEHDLLEMAANITSIGTIHELRDELNKALKCHQKALNIRTEKLGPDDPIIAETYINTAIVYRKMGECKKAIDYYNQALSIQKQHLAKNDPDIAITYNNLGNVYKDEGKYPKALRYHQKALDIRMKVYGTDHPITANSYMNLQDVLCATGDYQKALEYALKAADIMESHFGADSLQTADAYFVLGKAYAEIGNHDLALQNFTKVLDISTLHFGEEHPRTIRMKEYMESYKGSIKPS